jgi:putative metalloenzyme radical SAM/SPASM domain maturase
VPNCNNASAAAANEEAAFRPYPSKLFVETTTYCNLLCPMCVKQAADSRIIDGHLSQQTFAALEPAFPFLESLVLNGIGEPLMHPHLLEWVARARQKMPASAWIGFQSNGLLLDKQTALDLVDAGLDRICLSVDGVSPDTFSRVREGESLSDMEKAFAVLAEARHARPGCRLKVGSEFVTMRENFHQLPDTIRWVAERGADFFIVSQAVPYGPAQANQITYHNASEAAVELFDTWKQKMADMGLDIYKYDYMAWERERVLEHHVDPRIRQINAMVTEMRAEARKLDIFMDVMQLLKRDTTLQSEVETIYGEAQRVADEMGIELKLPVTIPLAERKCDFVTGGSAFISWDGGVHPCYHLWHRYRCYINDWDRLVKPKEFGHLSERPLLEIWNDSGFRTFRRNVAKFDYPYCANCCVAPCDLVQAEDFLHDCFANDEPCGSCPWAMGLLQCLQ